MENLSTIRRISFLYSSIDIIRLKVYIDGSSVPAYMKSFNGTSSISYSTNYFATLPVNTAAVQFTRLGIRAKFVQIEISTEASTYPVSLHKLSIEVD